MPRLSLASLVLLASALAGPALAQPPAADPAERLREADRDPKVYEQYWRVGKKVAAFCANCHGEGGNSLKPDVPNLAGQNTAYLLEQVRQFADGRRKNLFMEGLVKALSADEKVGVAVYYAAQQVAPQPAADAALTARGKDYYGRICFRCHGELGTGTAQYARIAGQQPEYLTVTLKRYRDGSSTRMDPVMAANTRNMSDADLKAVVAYVSTMK
jgi:cytochrome c553